MAKEKNTTVELADLVDIEIGEFPCVDKKGRTFGLDTADQLIETYAAFGDRIKAPLVLGHNEADTGQITTGMPALGWGGSLRKVAFGKGVKVLASIRQVPALIADLINKGAYKRISQAFWLDGAEAGIPEAKGKAVLRHIGLLGADTPRIKTLEDVRALYQPAQSPVAAFADTAEADVAEFSMDAAPAAAEAPESLQDAVEAEADADTMQPLFSGVQARLWALQEDGRKGKTTAEIIAGLETLGTELQTICTKMREMPGAPPAAAAAAMADPAGGTAVAEPQKTTDAVPAVGQAGTVTAAAPAAAAPPAKSEGENVPSAAPARQGDAVASPAEPATAAASPKPQAASPAPAAVEMSDSAKQAVETFITRATAKGRLLPKHHASIRSQAVACFAHGGDEAVASFCDDQATQRTAQVIDLGETGKAKTADAATATFADCDPAAAADAGEEFDRSKIGSLLGVKRESFVAVRAKAKR